MQLDDLPDMPDPTTQDPDVVLAILAGENLG